MTVFSDSSIATGDYAGTRTRGWTIVAIELLLLFAACLFCWETTATFIAQWMNTDNETYSHTPLIVLISIWLIVRNRALLATLPVERSWFAVTALLVVAGCWLLAVKGGVQTAHQLLLPVMAWLAIYASLGRTVAIASIFPFAYLEFATTIWNLTNGTLQTLTVIVSRALLDMVGVTAFVDGHLIHLPMGTFEVAGGCSGLHFFIVALALGALYGEVHRDGMRTRLQQIALAALFGLLANWIRVFVIIVAGYLTDMQHYLVRVEHYRFGWFVFAVVMAGYFFLASRVASKPVSDSPRAFVREGLGQSTFIAVGVALVVLIAAPAWSYVVRSRLAPPKELAVFAAIEQWTQSNQSDLSWRPRLVQPDQEIQRSYVKDAAKVDLYVATYFSQLQGKELINSENAWSQHPRVEVVEARAIDSDRVGELIIREDARLSVVRYQYRIGPWRTASALRAQLYLAFHSLYRTPSGSVIAVHSECVSNECDSAAQVTRAFWRAAGFEQ